MFISELFYSIQGEGELTGMPSVFVRTSGCNLRCNWCDTMYASWHPEGTEMTIPQIVAKVESFPASHCVLTGGEPMVAKDIHELAGELKALGKHITIETAGTVPPESIACDLASLSPKLANSTPDGRLPGEWRQRHEQTRLQPNVLRAWIDRYSFQLKFVVSSASDLEEIHAMLKSLDRKISPSKILLMPEGTSAEIIRGRDDTLIDICKRFGYRYCNRLHVEVFGHTRGT
jgi:7-carboxy-7-deazaguanine synthase